MKMTPLDDRRVRKTHKALRNALAELMVDKNLRHITVRELTNKADVHRSTFYAHYKDIYDLYEQVEHAVLEELSDMFTKNVLQAPSKFFTILIAYIMDNKQLCRMLFSAHGDGSFLNRLNTLFEDKCLEAWCNECQHREAEEGLKYWVCYHVYSCLAIISRWVESNFAYPMDTLAKILGDIDATTEHNAIKRFKPS